MFVSIKIRRKTTVTTIPENKLITAYLKVLDKVPTALSLIMLLIVFIISKVLVVFAYRAKLLQKPRMQLTIKSEINTPENRELSITSDVLIV